MNDLITDVTDYTFADEVLRADLPVLVDFWAEWCGPCKMIAPVLDEISIENTGRLKVVRVNIDENQGTPGKYGVRGIPTLLLFKNGELAGTKVGAASKSILEEFVSSHL